MENPYHFPLLLTASSAQKELVYQIRHLKTENAIHPANAATIVESVPRVFPVSAVPSLRHVVK